MGRSVFAFVALTFVISSPEARAGKSHVEYAVDGGAFSLVESIEFKPEAQAALERFPKGALSRLGAEYFDCGSVGGAPNCREPSFEALRKYGFPMWYQILRPVGPDGKPVGEAAIALEMDYVADGRGREHPYEHLTRTSAKLYLVEGSDEELERTAVTRIRAGLVPEIGRIRFVERSKAREVALARLKEASSARRFSELLDVVMSSDRPLPYSLDDLFRRRHQEEIIDAIASHTRILLEDPDPSYKTHILHDLQASRWSFDYKHPKVAEIAREFLADPHPDVSGLAAIVVAEDRWTPGVQPGPLPDSLKQRLRETILAASDWVAGMAATALIRFPLDREDERLMVSLLARDNSRTLSPAIDALGKIRADEELIEVFEGMPVERLHSTYFADFVDQVKSDRATSILVSMFHAGDRWFKDLIFRKLLVRTIPQSELGRLEELTRSKEPGIRARTYHLIERMPGDRATRILMKGMSTDDKSTIRQALMAVLDRRIKGAYDDAQIDSLIGLLRTTGPEICEMAALQLGDTASAKALEALIARIDDPRSCGDLAGSIVRMRQRLGRGQR